MSQRTKNNMLFALLFIGISCSAVGFGDTESMNITLSRINTLLAQINPLINVAEKQQDRRSRVKFQFARLRADVSKIQQGIARQIHHVSIEPRIVAPLSGDYHSLPALKTDSQQQNSL